MTIEVTYIPSELKAAYFYSDGDTYGAQFDPFEVET